MKITMPVLWLTAAVTAFIIGIFGESEEVIMLSAIPAIISLGTYIFDLRKEVALKRASTADHRFDELEGRLRLVEGELDQANLQIERLRLEREFDRQLLPGGAGMPQRGITASD